MSLFFFFDYHVRNWAWCLRKRFPFRMLLCDVWFKDIPASTHFDHPYGITIRRGVKVGEDCTFTSNVTIGARRNEDVYAVVGKGVYFGTGSTVLGAVTIGDYAVIGANAVVLKDVPSYTTFVVKQL